MDTIANIKIQPPCEITLQVYSFDEVHIFPENRSFKIWGGSDLLPFGRV